ncbi:hypothetical protein QMK19_03160 [Streptomyces sp. H10-C2]|uniref:DUF6197 family protein n=1 Tax=unclassified Streptomyces TaxID=2593676 RepID=UPI0024B8846B|nr:MULTISPECIES: hypothetical protein [unclassified Streptomyces]MDJ0342184.1 hypothetical protein [Streptomyces sp. PH10-H1]MDJ0368698.1 hypothetical protein [Streptomyces sp. H10-C2]
MSTTSVSRPPLPVRPLRPMTVPAVFRAAARLLVANGHYQGDYCPDVFDREMCIPHFLRPLSIVAALKCVVVGNPHTPSPLADEAIGLLALRLEVGGEVGPYWGDIVSLEEHIAAWGDVEGRTVETVVAVLEAAADASAVSV